MRWLVGGILGLLAGQTVIGQPTTATGQGLIGDYFDGTNFERKVFTRTDPQINFDWERGEGPGRGLGQSFYSVRWNGKLYAPTTGIYKFTATVDDGIRLWVGGKKVIDVWRLNDSQTFEGTVSLKAGQYYDFRVDYFNDIRGGSIRLFWIPPNETSPRFVDGNRLFKPTYQSPRPVEPKPVEKPVAPKPRPALVRTKPVLAPKPTNPVRTPAPVPAKKPDRFADLKPGDQLTLNQVLFVQSEYRLLPESYAELEQLLRAMKQNPALRIEISGHTDNVGDARLNRALSENRASVVASYLIRNGIGSERIETRGYGGTRPVADNATEAGRSKNRRVEFVVK